MSDELAALLEEYYRRQALGEELDAHAFSARAGANAAAFLRHVGAAGKRAPRRGQPFPIPFGAYLLLRDIGRGGHGVVYEAVHRGLGRKVALKILRAARVGDEQALARFRREAKLCSQVRHDCIVEIFESGEVEGRPYFVMELVEGRTLDELVRAGAAPEPRALARAMADVADAVHLLHEAGVVHRDLKPGNVMVRPDGRPVLTDFGLARGGAPSELTRTGDALGSPAFLSPEQLLGLRDEIDARSDVYGLGATLYFGLTGRAPASAADGEAMLRGVLEAPPRAPRGVPPALRRVVLRALAKRRDQRQPDAATLRDQLRAAAEAPAFRRGRAVLAIAALLLIAVGVFFWARRPATLTVRSFPVAQVRVNGELLGPSNATYAIAPGEHTLQLAVAGFRTATRTVDVAAGGSFDLDLVLVVEDPADPAQVARLAELLEIELAVPVRGRGSVQRALDDGLDRVTQPVMPRGDVAPEDVDGVWIRVSAYDEGRLVFRAGGAALHDAPYAPEHDWSHAALPAPVRAALVPGAEIAWGFATTDREHLARVRVVDGAAVADRLAAIDARLGASPAPLRALLRAQVLLDAGRFYGAWRAARRAAGAPPAHVLAIEQAALDGMGVEEPRLRRDLEARRAALMK